MFTRKYFLLSILVSGLILNCVACSIERPLETTTKNTVDASNDACNWLSDGVTFQEFACALEPNNKKAYFDSEKVGIIGLIKNLPKNILANSTFKKGTPVPQSGFTGRSFLDSVTGHLVPPNDSRAATPEKPSVIVWDDSTALTLSWGGLESHKKFFNRVDAYGFDWQNKKHILIEWSPTKGFSPSDCQTCHGPNNRPIFPMYPDWPHFYGEANDELDEGSAVAVNTHQAKVTRTYDRQKFKNFVSNQITNPRYAPLFQDLEFRRKLWKENAHYYPYRPNNLGGLQQTSRAFIHRPNLRLGVLLNRTMALQVFEHIKAQPLWQKYRLIFLFNTLDCNWQNFRSTRALAFDALETDLKNIMGYSKSQIQRFWLGHDSHFGSYAGGTSPYVRDKTYRQIPYEQMLGALNLKIQDVDFRFKYHTKLSSAGNHVYSDAALYNTRSIMDLGYLKSTYSRHPGANFSYLSNARGTHGMRYFNSYFDGSATTNELLASLMIKDMGDILSLGSHYHYGLTDKYRRANNSDESPTRYGRDLEFFRKMDGMSRWIPAPYPSQLLNYHNRDYFWSTTRGKMLQRQHGEVCTAVGNAVENTFGKANR